MTIRDLTQPEALELIDSNEENRRLKFTSKSHISIFQFSLLKQNTDRQCSVSLDTTGIIRAIAMYRFRPEARNYHGRVDYTLISIGVDEAIRGQRIDTQLLDHVLKMMRQRVEVVTLQISPDEKQYRERWEKFLYEKCRSHGLQLRDRIF